MAAPVFVKEIKLSKLYFCTIFQCEVQATKLKRHRYKEQQKASGVVMLVEIIFSSKQSLHCPLGDTNLSFYCGAKQIG